MHQGPHFSALGFKVLQQQKRELSVNHSIISSVNLHGGSYEELLQHFKNLVSDKIDLSLIHSSPHLKLKKYKEAVYYGQYIEGKRQGKGIMVYHSGQRYEGDWKNDQRHGAGYEIFANSSTYQGDYFENKMQGQGKYCWPTGQTYEGQFANNLKHGSGMWIDSEGNSYLGEWKLGEAFGFGVYTQSQGSRYEGNFLNFMKSGKGTEKFESGDLYQGQYSLGRFNGYGQYYWKDGSYYKGNFSNGLRNGHGLWRKGEGNEKYQGQFANNRKQGYGIYTWSCGNIYKGSYLANLRHGNGEMYWIDGSFYKGQWLVDKPNGKGELFDGYQKVQGNFKDGQLIERMEDQQQRRLSQFYTETPLVHRRYIQTPIKKITKQFYDTNHKNRRLVLSQVEKDQQVRQIKITKSNKKVNPLVKDSYLKKRLLQTIALQPSNQHRDSQQIRLRETSKSNQRQKVLHSSFQIHRLHKKKNNTINVNNMIELTSDNNQKFAFGGGSAAPRRNRYFSRLE